MWFCINNSENKVKDISVKYDINIKFNIENKFDSSLTYKNIQIWISNTIVFEDTTQTEYLFDNKEWPRSFKINKDTFVVYLKIFDAPDYNKLFGFVIANNKIVKRDTLPFIQPKNKKKYFGILHITETPCDNCDSCYYNPQLFYSLTSRGFVLDSVLTIEENRKFWGKFYGFNQRLDLIIPCPPNETNKSN